MQVQSLVPIAPGELRAGPIAVLMNVLRTTGVRGMWLGHTGTMIRETGGAVVWFGTKEAVASLLVSWRNPSRHDRSLASSRDLKPWESALSGACAGAAFNLAFFPADTVKSAIQTRDELLASSPASASPSVPHSPNNPTSATAAAPKPSFLQTFRAMYVSKGLKGLYAGCGITILRSIPSSAMIFLIWDGLNKRFPN
jgi:mitochondrial ornithine carrier protein